MTQRVKIDGSASSPFRVSTVGVAVDSAEFNNLIFDGNQSPLRLWATGYVTVAGITDTAFNGGKNIEVLSSGTSFPTASGTTPVFITMSKRTDPAGNPNGFVMTPYFGQREGGGGGICSNIYVGANFHAGIGGSGGAPGPSAYCQYCIFKDNS